MAKSADRKAATRPTAPVPKPEKTRSPARAAAPAKPLPPSPPSPGRKFAGVILGIAAQRLLAAGVRRLLRRLR
ncbi:hypothetical protein [Sphingopyxis panaciterrulae]|uniref:Uncharacterized protein n=1 Tax=Sphingopyxis panaciterrulae TaxID=462372 RepID=A0A7W9B5A7_9SPHN|nr:hypothetical protein [Sphingopyxis panaciterrulae]MBB5706532.1 hypothetical protein [Sphingopyxis panaciterrulae]